MTRSKYCECEYAELCPAHPYGEGCILQNCREWVKTCSTWQELNKEALLQLAYDSGGD